MTLPEVMDAVEQDDFSAEMNLAAGTAAFRQALATHPLFRRLVELTKENPGEIVARIENISHRGIDIRYENPFDVALSAYLMALSESASPEAVPTAANAVLGTPQCWWASGIAHELALQPVGHRNSR